MKKHQKHGFVYIWRDKRHNRYYIGCHWGFENDNYICSSQWMMQAYFHRPEDFKRRILKTNIQTRKEMYIEEQHWMDMIKPEEIKPKALHPRYYNLRCLPNTPWNCDDDKKKTIGEKISAAKTGKSVPCSPEKASAISKAKKGKPLTEQHKAALRKPKNTIYDDERRGLIGQKSQSFWDSKEGQALKAKRAQEGVSEKTRQKTSQTLKERGHKPSKECKEASIKRCSKTYKVISPTGEEMTVTNLKAFCRERNLTDINMVRSSGSKGWKAFLIS